MTSDSAKCAKCAKCFNYARGSGSVFFTPDGVEINRLEPIAWLKHFAHFAHFARIIPGPPPAPRPPPPPPPAADAEPSPGHPTWDRPPVEELDGREPANWDGVGPVLDTPWPMPKSAPVLACDVPWLHPEVSAYAVADGGTTLLCPFCGQQHHHGGFGHWLAHCANPQGRGYLLVEVEVVPPWLIQRAPAAELRP